MPDPIRELVDEMLDATRTPGPQLRQGVVTATATGPNRVTIKLGGSTVAIAGVRYLASYSPTVNDTVFVLANGVDLLVLGKLA